MTSAQPISTEIDAETMAIVDRLARRRGISPGQFAAEAIRRVAESDDDFDAFVQARLDALECGDVVPHEQVMLELETMIATHRARCG